ncbi:MAG: hypothetical protein AAF702_32120 [Chloroflexota bacterium]
MTIEHPFPLTRPSIAITESTKTITELDCPELQWWSAIPHLHDHTMRAFYEVDTLELNSVVNMAVTGPAQIHQIDCIEIAVNEWTFGEPIQPMSQPSHFYCKLDPDKTQWLGVTQLSGGEPLHRTFEDEYFTDGWGVGEQRRLVDDGKYQRQPDKSYKITDGQGIGAGTYDVTIGDNTFCCLRVLDMIPPHPNEQGELVEAFIEPSGRSVLIRQHLGRYWGRNRIDWTEKYHDNQRLVIDGSVYVHCNCSGRAHDVLTNTGIGMVL